MFSSATTIVHDAPRFSHDDADRLSRLLQAKAPKCGSIVLDLHEARETTTPAFARLVLLRRDLLRAGRDLLLSGLQGRTQSLYEINHLEAVLPRKETGGRE